MPTVLPLSTARTAPVTKAVLGRQEGHGSPSPFVDTLVRLYALGFDAVGLGDYRRPQGHLARQVWRWNGQWEKSRTHEVREVTDLGRWLADLFPSSVAPPSCMATTGWTRRRVAVPHRPRLVVHDGCVVGRGRDWRRRSERGRALPEWAQPRRFTMSGVSERPRSGVCQPNPSRRWLAASSPVSTPMVARSS